jgi:hypothetical protein
MTKIANLSAQEFFQRTPRKKGPAVVAAVDCVYFVSAPVDATLASTIAHDLRDWFPAMSKCIYATLDMDADGRCYPAFVNARLRDLFVAIVEHRLSKAMAQ